MSSPILGAPQIHELIRRLSRKHILRKSHQDYVDDFVMANLLVYDPDALEKELQHKFFIPDIPDESNYSDEVYYQSASELSVSYYLKQKENQGLVTNFELEKRLNFNPNDNPANRKDVDNFFHVGATRVSVEVKCPQEDKEARFPGTITLKSAGRLPDPKQIDRMRDELEFHSTGASGSKFAS